MNRLQSELQRLYLPRVRPRAPTDLPPSGLMDADGQVRALVLALRNPPNWQTLSTVWQGVQAELELPAPAIAVSGTDALQLWFSLAEPVAPARAHAFLERLRQRFLPDVDARRVLLLPAPDASAEHPGRHAAIVPAEQGPTGNWSAFLAPDLAPVFSDTPWLDIPPGDEGQATLLRGIEVTRPASFAAACAQLGLDTAMPVDHAARDPAADGPMAPVGSAAVPASEDPKRFLLQVMNDPGAPLALRVDAAKALLPYSAR